MELRETRSVKREGAENSFVRIGSIWFGLLRITSEAVTSDETRTRRTIGGTPLPPAGVNSVNKHGFTEGF